MAIAKISYKKLNTAQRNLKSFDFNYFLNGLNSVVDESVQSVSNAKLFKNFSVKNYVLSTGLGIVPLQFFNTKINQSTTVQQNFEGQALALFVYQYFDSAEQSYNDVLFVYSSDKKLYYLQYSSNSRNFVCFDLKTFESFPDYLYYIMPDESEVAMFCSDTEKLTVVSSVSNCTTIENAPLITSLCVHFDRIFAVTTSGKNRAWFSDELDPTNWNVSNSEAGYIAMNDSLGECKKVLSFKNYVFVFREYGITRITAYASQESFSMQNVYISSNLLFSNTASICGDVIYFLASDGLYSFDGVNVNKINSGLEKIIEGCDESNAKAVYFQNSYYIILNTQLSEQTNHLKENNTLIRYDCNSYNYDILSDVKIIDIAKITTSGLEKLAVVQLSNFNSSEDFETKLGQVEFCGGVFDNVTDKVWCSPKTDIGVSNYNKNVCAISLQTNAYCDVVIKTENGERKINFSPCDKTQKKAVYITGTMIEVYIHSSSKDVKISHPIIYYKLGKSNV